MSLLIFKNEECVVMDLENSRKLSARSSTLIISHSDWHVTIDERAFCSIFGYF